MSLPTELQRWVCCPKCGAIAGLKRLGNVGVPKSRYGKRRRTHDSKRIKCLDCSIIFRSSQQTMWEAFGRDPREEVPF